MSVCLPVCLHLLLRQAVELTASQNLAQKRSGYLTAALTLSPTHEFRFMLVNQMQRDLNSSNMLEASAALTALCKLGESVSGGGTWREYGRLSRFLGVVLFLGLLHPLSTSVVSVVWFYCYSGQP